MIKKLKNLDYISLKISDNLDKTNVTYIDYDSRVFTKTIICNLFEIDDIKLIPDAVEQFFIEFNYLLNEPIIIKEYSIKEAFDKYFNNLKLINDRFNNKDKFIMISDKFKNNFEYDAKIVISKFLEKDEIIFGYKTKIDQPGIILITNEDGVKDKNKIRLGVMDIGSFANRAYYILKIIN